MNDIEFKNKFIGFVDILGFKKMVEAAEARVEMTLQELLEAVKDLGCPEDRKRFENYGPKICPKSTYLRQHIDFRVTQISDCVIVSSEVSPAGVINLMFHCWKAVMLLLEKGMMCRGYITHGSIYHNDDQIIGSGYQNAYFKEAKVTAFKHDADERGTPFVEVDQSVCNYVRDCNDPCVKEMFSRFVKGDGSIIALFPFKRLSISFLINRDFNPEEQKRSNNNMRMRIENYKKRIMALVDQTNPNAVSKVKHYIAALNTQLEVCTRTDEMIDMLKSPYPTLSMSSIFNKKPETDR